MQTKIWYSLQPKFDLNSITNFIHLEKDKPKHVYVKFKDALNMPKDYSEKIMILKKKFGMQTVNDIVKVETKNNLIPKNIKMTQQLIVAIPGEELMSSINYKIEKWTKIFDKNSKDINVKNECEYLDCLLNKLKDYLNIYEYKETKLETHSYITLFKILNNTKSTILVTADANEYKKKILDMINAIRTNLCMDLMFYRDNDFKIMNFIYEAPSNNNNNTEAFYISDGSLCGISIDKKNDTWYGTSCIRIEFHTISKQYHIYPEHNIMKLLNINKKYNIYKEKLTNETIDILKNTFKTYNKDSDTKNIIFDEFVKDNEKIPHICFFITAMEGIDNDNKFINLQKKPTKK